MLAVSQQRDLQVNSDDPHLISWSSSAHEHQEKKISYQFRSFDFSAVGSTCERAGGI